MVHPFRTFVTCLLILLSGSYIATSYAEDKQVFKWRLLTTWPEDLPILQEGVRTFTREVKTMSNGRLDIEPLADGALGPDLLVFDAVSQRKVEMGHSVSYYWANKIPGCELFASVPFGMTARGKNAWLYYGKGLELWKEIYAPFQVRPFPMGNTGVQMGGWFKKRIDKITDFDGLRMRIPGLGGMVLKQLGVTPVPLLGKDIRAYFQDGRIDAAEWVGPYHDAHLGDFRKK
jgi:TRAP-type mannitol/chloroaromatic compound transport system substrate-binding protein